MRELRIVVGGLLGLFFFWWVGPWAISIILNWVGIPVPYEVIKAAVWLLIILGLFGLIAQFFGGVRGVYTELKKLSVGTLRTIGAVIFGLATFGCLTFLFGEEMMAAHRASSPLFTAYVLGAIALGTFSALWAKGSPNGARFVALCVFAAALLLIVIGRGKYTGGEAARAAAEKISGFSVAGVFNGGAAEVYPISWEDVPPVELSQEFHLTLKASEFGGKWVDLTQYCGINEFPAGSVVSIRVTGRIKPRKTGPWYGPEGGQKTAREVEVAHGSPEYISDYPAPDLPFAGLVGKADGGQFLVGKFWACRVVKIGKLWAGPNTLPQYEYRKEDDGEFDVILAVSYGY